MANDFEQRRARLAQQMAALDLEELFVDCQANQWQIHLVPPTPHGTLWFVQVNEAGTAIQIASARAQLDEALRRIRRQIANYLFVRESDHQKVSEEE